MKYCPKCGKEYGDETKFCQVDGTPLETKIELKTCPSCNAENPSTANFCNECGQKINLIKYRCSNQNCRKVFTDGSKFCKDCGGKIEEYREKTKFDIKIEKFKKKFESDFNKEKEEKLQELRGQLEQKENKLQDLQEHLKQKEIGEKKYEDQISKLKGELKQLTTQNNELKNQLEQIEAKLEEYIKKENDERKKNLIKITNEEDFVLLDKYKTPFYISKCQVTQELYEKVMEQNPSHFKGNKLPVETVSWYDAIYFCNLLSEKEGLMPVYSVNKNTDVKQWDYTRHNGEEIKGNIEQNEKANGYRLPTEEEWEYAARGGENYEYSGSDNLDEVGWYEKNSKEEPHNVRQLKANAYGLYDMSGNVWEWCWESEGKYNRYCRGGSWYYYDYNCKISGNMSFPANFREYYLGFRIIRKR